MYTNAYAGQYHTNNWIVVRSGQFRKQMQCLEPRDINEKEKPAVAFKTANTLIRAMQMHGPNRNEFPNYAYDTRNDLHHCHVTMGHNSYDVIWDVFEDRKLIYIIEIAPRENFDYTRRHNKRESQLLAESELVNNDHYKRLFSTPNMQISDKLRLLHQETVLGKDHGQSESRRTIITGKL